MKGFLLLMLLTASSMTICAQTNKSIKSYKADSIHAKVIYSCTMHPEIISDNPGKCPKCGMTLIKKNQRQRLTIIITDLPNLSIGKYNQQVK